MIDKKLQQCLCLKLVHLIQQLYCCDLFVISHDLISQTIISLTKLCLIAILMMSWSEMLHHIHNKIPSSGFKFMFSLHLHGFFFLQVSTSGSPETDLIGNLVFLRFICKISLKSGMIKLICLTFISSLSYTLRVSNSIGLFQDKLFFLQSM